MKWILVVVGALAVIVAVVLIVGASLPQNHTASRTARFSAPPETVWDAITGVADYGAWRGDVDSVEMLPAPPGKFSWRESSGSDKVTYETVTIERPSRFAVRIADKGLPFGGEWEYRLEPDGTGSRVTITENGEVYNPVFRFVSRYVMGHTATIDKYLKALAAKLGDSYEPGRE